jgi:hypothetical protein
LIKLYLAFSDIIIDLGLIIGHLILKFKKIDGINVRNLHFGPKYAINNHLCANSEDRDLRRYTDEK